MITYSVSCVCVCVCVCVYKLEASESPVTPVVTFRRSSSSVFWYISVSAATRYGWSPPDAALTDDDDDVDVFIMRPPKTWRAK